MDMNEAIENAKQFADRATPRPEFGIDWWDIPEYCPFHGFVKSCACMGDMNESE
jgi:hypothetical protein